MQNDWMGQLHAISHELQAVSDRCAQLAGDLHYVMQKAEEARRMSQAQVAQSPAGPIGYSYGSAFRQGTAGHVGAPTRSISTSHNKQPLSPAPSTWDSPNHSSRPVISGGVDGVQESWTVGSSVVGVHSPYIDEKTPSSYCGVDGNTWATNSEEHSAARQSEYTPYTRM